MGSLDADLKVRTTRTLTGLEAKASGEIALSVVRGAIPRDVWHAEDRKVEHIGNLRDGDEINTPTTATNVKASFAGGSVTQRITNKGG
jgi:hypothetical protein